MGQHRHRGNLSTNLRDWGEALHITDTIHNRIQLARKLLAMHQCSLT
jgi:hypothetical protein